MSSLSNILCLPKVPFNSLFINQLTYSYNYDVFFFLGYCVSQDHLMEKIFGKGYESGGLYVHNEEVP